MVRAVEYNASVLVTSVQYVERALTWRALKCYIQNLAPVAQQDLHIKALNKSNTCQSMRPVNEICQ